MIYLDYNATTPIDPAVADVMEPFIRQHFGNPSSLHPEGSFARRAVEQAREQTALLLGAAPDEIVFTSGGSESNNMALKGAIADSGRRKAHLITSVTEHPSVLNVCRWLERQGHDITYLPVDHYGRSAQWRHRQPG